MTDEAKALAFNLPLARKLVDNPKTQLPAAMQRQAVDFIEVQAREIERLRGVLALKDQYFKGITKLAALGETSAALAGDSHDQ